MRHTTARGLLTLALVVGLLGLPAAAQTRTDIGGVASSNVTWLGQVTDAMGVAEGGRLVDGYFYATVNGRGLLIFDVRTPAAPRLVGRLALPHLAENEDVATNGEIALLSQGSVARVADDNMALARELLPLPGMPEQPVGGSAVSALHVVDVRDKAHPRIRSTLLGAGDHTYTCLDDCSWAYGGWGNIIDLRDPNHPRLLERRWTEMVGVPDFYVRHDVVEVRPGLVLTSTQPMLALNTTDPAAPRVIAQSDGSRNTSHNVAWPNAGRDRFILSASENAHPRCETRDSGGEVVDGFLQAVKTWDTTGWRDTGAFKPLHEYFVRNGTYLDGQPAVSGAMGCSPHWLDAHPSFRNGGLFAEASYGHGVRFVDVASDGRMTEVGWFLGWGANTSAVYWISDEIAYAVDMQRGIDILRFDRKAPADTTPAPPPLPAVTGVGVTVDSPVAWSCRLPRARQPAPSEAG